MDERKRAQLILGGVIGAFVLSVVGIFYFQHIAAKIIFGIIAVALGVFLVRNYLTYKRKKYYVAGRVLAVTYPKGRLSMGRTVIMVKEGKVSRKLYSWDRPKLKIGSNYAFYCEEKTNNILKYDAINASMASGKVSRKNLPPQYRY